ncbi:MAG TPA: histone [Candidatus Nanoarchaeia archaeon]|nr:histone [Candidatus Nanoarchaeia archaeon]
MVRLIIPRAAATRILMDCGAKRVSSKGAAAFSELIEKCGISLAGRAVELARHAGRKTVDAADMKMSRR